MLKTISTLVDSHHFFHPKELKDKADHDKPTFFRRIAGVVLLALSIPFTFGIVTGLYTYWAHRKVVHIEKQNRSDLDQRVEKAFGQAVEGEEKSPEQGIFEDAVSALHKGNKNDLMARVKDLDPKEKDSKIKNALIAAAIAYDRFEVLHDIWKECGKVHLPLHEARSSEMIAAIVDHLGGDKQAFLDRPFGEENNTALHHQQNLGVVKALTERGAKFLQNAKGETPLHLCTDPEIAKHFIDHYGKKILLTANANGQIPLLTNTNVEVLRVLIEEMEDIQMLLDNNGNTILHYFGFEPIKNHPELIHDVLAKVEGKEALKAFVNTPNRLFMNPLYYNLPLQVVKAIVEAGADYTVDRAPGPPLHTCESAEVAAYLIKHFGDEILEKADENNLTPLMVVRNPEVIQVLIDKGAKVDAKEPKYEKQPLFFAKSVEVAEKLIKAGADPKALDKLNGNALFGSITPEVAKWLVETHGLDVHQQNTSGKEAIHFIDRENYEMAKVLMGERDKTYNWGENIPPVVSNPIFFRKLEREKYPI